MILKPNAGYVDYARRHLKPISDLPGLTSGLLENKDTSVQLAATAADLLTRITASETDLSSLWTSPPKPNPTPTPPPAPSPHPGDPTPKPLPPSAGGTATADAAATPAPVDLPWNENCLADDLQSLASIKRKILATQQSLIRLGPTLDAQVAAITLRFNAVRNQSYYGNLPGEVAGLGRFSFTVPNKTRPFSINVPRSAFIARTTTLAIQNGVLLGFSHSKPSEVEGFTVLPLTIAQKLAGIPKALITSKAADIQGQDSVITSRTQLINDQRALKTATHPPPSATPAPTP